MAKAGDITFKPGDEKEVASLVTIGDGERDAVLRAEAFVREYFGDDNFVAARAVEVGVVAKGTLYNVIGY